MESYICNTISQSQIKRIRSLSQKKYREESGFFVVEGEKMVNELLCSGFVIDSIFKRDDIGEKAMSQISNLTTPSPILAVVKIPDNKELLENHRIKGLSLALDSISDPGNMGTIMRIADWFGIDTVYACGHTVDIYNSKVVQASMGAIFRVRVIYAEIDRVISDYNCAGKPVYGTFLEGESIYQAELSAEGLIIMGNESGGISAGLEKNIERKVFIPPYPVSNLTPESLNVAVATGIICAEFRKREA